MKQYKTFEYDKKKWVAPPAGAWIETCNRHARESALNYVAPPAGAWIETYAGFPL